ncbi:hypothetical protein F5887DRAFT_71558 [Amanita rubescens]|nr:hypothetical protein F5887DRAFT_71558 [Amanita rubescens]
MPAERRERRRPPSSPSSLILSLLAALDADARPATPSPTPLPTPLPFLCPSFSPCPSDYLRHPSSAYSSPSAHSWPLYRSSDAPSALPSPTISKILPDRYEQGSDGLWRKVALYTLYGSTVCGSSTNAAKDQMWPPAPSSPITDPAMHPTVDITDSLPPGWKPSSVQKHTSLTVIISLVLAMAICALIIGCLFLRRVRHRRKLRNGDLEMKARNKRRRQSSDNDSLETMISKEKEHKTTQALWARATARWKANARYVARQRRGKRGIILRASQVTGVESTTPETAPQFQQDRDDGELPSAEVEARSPERVPSPESSGPVLPPAYQCRSADSSLDSIDASIFPTDSSNQPLSSHPRAAHLATDDKAILAQMVDLVSAPLGEGPTDVGVSVPAWSDEGEEFVMEGGQCRNVEPTPPMESPSFMPAPPSKAKMALNYLDHHYLYDDVESQIGPPAPPFQEAFDLPPPPELPSAPPALFDSELSASAPSWEDDVPDCDNIDSLYISSLPIHGPVDINGRPPGYQPQ